MLNDLLNFQEEQCNLDPGLLSSELFFEILTSNVIVFEDRAFRR